VGDVHGAIAVAVAFISGVLGGGHTQPPPAHVFTAPQLQTVFHRQTGMRLVPFTDGSTDEVKSFRTAPHKTARFGDFQVFVVRPDRIAKMRRVFTHGGNAVNGVYWVPDGADGWIAVRLLEKNLVLAWFPPYPTQSLDARFDRLTKALRAIAPEVRALPSG
jgi:hypothetical protein